MLFMFGIATNYLGIAVRELRGEVQWTWVRLLWPLQVFSLVTAHGLVHGLGLGFVSSAVASVWYFTVALMNHNTATAQDVASQNSAKDWAEQQVRSSTDWCTHLSWWQASVFLWLNFHTVHHLFPHVDCCHHPKLQNILEETCSAHGIPYDRGSRGVWTIYQEMIQCFEAPQSPGVSFLTRSV